MTASGVNMMMKMMGFDPEALMRELHLQIAMGVEAAQRAEAFLAATSARCVAIELELLLVRRNQETIMRHMGLSPETAEPSFLKLGGILQ